MIERITADEIELMECLANPHSAVECIFNDLENATHDWNEDLAHIRFAQFPMLNFEYLLDEDPKLSQKENFKLHEGMGNIDCFGGRLFGKTWFVEVIDMLIAAIWLDNVEAGFTSIDAIHIRAILEEKFIPIITRHPFFSMMLPDSVNRGINRSPSYKIAFRNGFTIVGINMNVQSRSPGSQFFGKHLKRLYIEEASFESKVVFDKRIDARSEDGCVTRSAGMTTFTRFSPAGKRFYSAKNRPWVCNLPQYSNPKWDERQKKEAVEKHGGENSISYRVYVKGEIVEDGMTVFDMERVKKCFVEDKAIKQFEITKTNFINFEDIIVVDRPPGIDEVQIHADIGEAAPTEIAIFFRKGDKYKYAYNITVFNLTEKEQPRIFMFLAQKLQASLIGIDTTDGTGRAIYRTLNQTYSQENLVWCAFNETLPVDFEKEADGRIKLDNDSKPVVKEEYVSEWSIKFLKELLYDQRIEVPMDYKLYEQLNGCVGSITGSRVAYSVVGSGTGDHLLAAFRVFAIGVWLNHFKKLKPLGSKKFGKTGA